MVGSWTKPHVNHEWLTTGTSYEAVWSFPYLLMSTDQQSLSGRYTLPRHKLLASSTEQWDNIWRPTTESQ